MTSASKAAKVRAQKRPLDAALELIVMAAGTAFLALGLRHWVAVVWGNDTAAARTPVAYGAHVELPAEAVALPPAIKWVMVLSAASTATVCDRTVGEGPLQPDGASVGILAADGPVARLAACSAASAGHGRVAEIAVIHREFGSIPATGFIVVDRMGRVVYGSYDAGYLSHVLPSLALLE